VNSDSDYARDDAYGGRALVAAFAGRESAHAAAAALRNEGFHDIWTGVTHGSDSAGGAESADESFGAKIGRFFSGQSEAGGLTDALVHHGVAPAEARRIDRSLAPGSIILTVDGSNHPELAAHIIEAGGGHIVAGESFGDDAALAGDSAYGSDDTILSGSQVLGYREPSKYARGARVDEQQRIQLREERLRIDKTRVPAGTAEVTTDVVEHQQSVDVPTLREELFIERRPVADFDQDAGDVEPITTGQTIRIPLTREQITVTKRPVVTEEVLVGKRQVTETQHVSETTREERLVTEGATTTGSQREISGMADTDRPLL
jgi:uncharacterized protein (TIGR02271 family)